MMYGSKEFETTINRDELFKAIEANMKTHQGVFEEALEGYRKEVIKILEERLKAAREGKQVTHVIALVQPVSRLQDYERVLHMLEMSTEEEITLSESQFAQYVRDEWEWKQQFLMANSTYSATAAEGLGTTD